MRPIVRSLILSALALGSCSYSLEDDIEGLRAEIVDIERQIPPEAPLWISEGPDRFDAYLEDLTPRVPDFLYLHLVRKLAAMKPSDPDAQAAGDFDLDDARSRPEKYRGKFWRTEGLIGELHTESIEDPKLPFKQVHAGVFFDRALRPVLFHVVLKPDVLILREDTVELTGLFLKNVEYLSKSGRKVVAPLFLGRALRRTL
jgi:hypothetical protein